ncbi:MAG: hydroxymethylglutaryl-CoA synthase [Candidatus Aenigmatarchaeota archaeon]|nr:MAG: hydroxymethylglutaryl-CoA synthase [Candidatus Aenigmarchaeota archaeon]
MKAGIVGYGAYIPRLRIKAGEIAAVWSADPEMVKNLKSEKAVPNMDEDCTTMAVEASRSALRKAGIKPADIEAVYVGSESHPYVVKSTSSIVGEALGATPHMMAADLEFACKAGTSAMQIVTSHVLSGQINYGLAGGSDTAQGRPGDALEYTAAAGAAMFIIGNKGILAEINDTFSFVTDTPDFWRRETQDFPRHGGRFTGEPAYFRHVVGATKGILEKSGTTVKDYDYFVFHQPNAKFPLTAAKMLEISAEKLSTGTLFPKIGNTYSAASLLGLCSVLDTASAGERILVTSFGSGAGSDSFTFTVTDLIEEKRQKAGMIAKMIDRKEYVGYSQYARYNEKIKGV